MLVVDSLLSGEESPGSKPRDYVMYFDPMDQSAYRGEEDKDDLFFAFELLNFNPADDPNGAFYIDSVNVERFDKSLLTTPTTVMVFNTSEDFSTWQFAGAPGYMTMSLSTSRDGSLALIADNDNGRHIRFLGKQQNG